MQQDKSPILSNRYRIEKKVAKGGMADIYLAEDIKLRRKVAVKILSANYAGDRNFVARFRSEAQVLAKLDHPNIVKIYDWGQFNSSYFIIMEYIDGISLKELIEKKGSIEPEAAAEYAKQICDALQAAHDNNLVHRDIKPQNILITSDNRVKVTDFGIAKSLNTDITKTLNIVGTAHYISPEQARGDVLDNRTDIYSLGIVIYEMLTGDLPFRGDTSIDISLKHISEKPVRPTQLIAGIPKKLENIVMTCIKKDPGQRYPDITDLKKDLENYLRKKPLLLGKTGKKSKRPTIVPERFLNNIPLTVTALVAVIFMALFVTYSVLYYQKSPAAESGISVPLLENAHVDTAEKILETLGLEIDITGEEYSDVIPEDYVIRQSPDTGSIASINDTVEVVISAGSSQSQVTVPNLTGIDRSQAQDILESYGFELGSVSSQYSDLYKKDSIISQSPQSGEETGAGTAVNIVTSKGPRTTMVPNIIGLDYNYALRQLDSQGMTVITRIAPLSQEITQPGMVVDVDPLPGTILHNGDVVEIWISVSEPLNQVPELAGLSLAEAVSELDSANIAYQVIYVESDYSFQKDEVLQQWPREGLYLQADSPVLLFVGK